MEAGCHLLLRNVPNFSSLEMASHSLIFISASLQLKLRRLLTTEASHSGSLHLLVRGNVFTHILGRIGECQSISLAVVFVALECSERVDQKKGGGI